VLSRLAWSLGLAGENELVTLSELINRFDPARLPTDPWFVDPMTWVRSG